MSIAVRVDAPGTLLTDYQTVQVAKRKRGAVYDAMLTVVNPERLLRTLFEGIGRSRAFGCGLMLVRRLRQA